jgi:hypothetical protein
VVGTLLEFIEDPLEDPLAIPARELVVNGVPWTESFRQVSPRDARLGDVEDRVHEGAVGQIRWPSTPPCFGRQQGFDPGPFSITQFVPVHSQTKPPDAPSRKLLVAEFGDRP